MSRIELAAGLKVKRIRGRTLSQEVMTQVPEVWCTRRSRRSWRSRSASPSERHRGLMSERHERRHARRRLAQRRRAQKVRAAKVGTWWGKVWRRRQRG